MLRISYLRFPRPSAARRRQRSPPLRPESSCSRVPCQPLGGGREARAEQRSARRPRHRATREDAVQRNAAAGVTRAAALPNLSPAPCRFGRAGARAAQARPRVTKLLHARGTFVGGISTAANPCNRCLPA